MADRDGLVPRDSVVYQEFVRLYQVARQLRPTSVDRWNGDLYAVAAENWGAFDPATGSIRLSPSRVLRHLTGSISPTEPHRQAQALATVLHEATHAGMLTDAPDEPNAVRTRHSLGLMEGIAEVRTLADFDLFTERSGYSGLVLAEPQYPGALTAAEGLIAQATGPAKSTVALLEEATRGPGVMHFDQLADAVVRNRLAEVVPHHPEHRRAVRAALIPTMTHAYWPSIQHRPADAGEHLANEVRQHLNAKVDEIRRYYLPNPQQPFPAEPPNPVQMRAPDTDVQHRVAGAEQMRFLAGQAPPTGAVHAKPALGDGARDTGATSVRPLTHSPSQRPPDRPRE
ncbi:hypothetical protein EV643_102618 [Kribbella sp. VKM Ac-2527]|uniref:Uncharacterized protein n=1 Tax=Kribbella caucasensis TaxID=2512215 RepID=A0A4R6KP23_9ACTN|nr:hypothetical protein [Kribbella sp. VKM Ac-2527]TDO52776.1 hypothetical protein EV643_102618 [Kribbella sp. VKM Ac-2527]